MSLPFKSLLLIFGVLCINNGASATGVFLFGSPLFTTIGIPLLAAPLLIGFQLFWTVFGPFIGLPLLEHLNFALHIGKEIGLRILSVIVDINGYILNFFINGGRWFLTLFSLPVNPIGGILGLVIGIVLEIVLLLGKILIVVPRGLFFRVLVPGVSIIVWGIGNILANIVLGLEIIAIGIADILRQLIASLAKPLPLVLASPH